MQISFSEKKKPNALHFKSWKPLNGTPEMWPDSFALASAAPISLRFPGLFISKHSSHRWHDSNSNGKCKFGMSRARSARAAARWLPLIESHTNAGRGQTEAQSGLFAPHFRILQTLEAEKNHWTLTCGASNSRRTNSASRFRNFRLFGGIVETRDTSLHARRSFDSLLSSNGEFDPQYRTVGHFDVLCVRRVATERIKTKLCQ